MLSISWTPRLVTRAGGHTVVHLLIFGENDRRRAISQTSATASVKHIQGEDRCGAREPSKVSRLSAPPVNCTNGQISVGISRKTLGLWVVKGWSY